MTETQDWKEAIAPELTPTFAQKKANLEQLNLYVAAIAGWENIEEWNPNPKTRKPKRTFTGTNKKHPELGVHIPDYTSDLNAITSAIRGLDIYYRVSYDPVLRIAHAFSLTEHDAHDETEAIALCKLLLQLAPKPEPQVQIIDDDGGIDEPTVIEAMFG